MNDPSSARNVLMDWLRGLASIWVAIFHFNEPILYRDTFWQALCKPGWLGVPVFFVVSGWCMGMILGRAPKADRFFFSRIARIIVPYWASLLLVALIVGLLLAFRGVNDITRLPRSPVELLATLSLTTRPVTGVPTVNWVYWSLSYEAAFYALLALGLLLKRPALLMLAVLPVCLWSAARDLVLPGGFRPLFWADQFALFALGYFGFLALTRKSWLFACALCVAVACRLLQPAQTGFAVATALLLTFSGRIPLPSGRFSQALTSVGHWSYSLYLIHVPIGVHLIGRLRSPWILAHPLAHIAFDLLDLAVCIGLSALFFRWVEKPSHELSKRLGRHGLTGLWSRTSVPLSP